MKYFSARDFYTSPELGFNCNYGTVSIILITFSMNTLNIIVLKYMHFKMIIFLSDYDY